LPDKVKEDLVKGANPNFVDWAGRSVLWLAVAAGNPSIVEQLLVAGADLNYEYDKLTVIDFLTKTPADTAEKVMRRLLLVSSGKERYSNAILVLALNREYESLVRELVQKKIGKATVEGFDEAINQGGCYTLQCITLVKFILDEAETTVAGQVEATFKHVRQMSWEIAEYVFDKGGLKGQSEKLSDLLMEMDRGYLGFVGIGPKQLPFIEKLLIAGAKPTREMAYSTAIYSNWDNSQIAILVLLVKYGVDINEQDTHKMTLLDWVTRRITLVMGHFFERPHPSDPTQQFLIRLYRWLVFKGAKHNIFIQRQIPRAVLNLFPR